MSTGSCNKNLSFLEPSRYPHEFSGFLYSQVLQNILWINTFNIPKKLIPTHLSSPQLILSSFSRSQKEKNQSPWWCFVIAPDLLFWMVLFLPSVWPKHFSKTSNHYTEHYFSGNLCVLLAIDFSSPNKVALHVLFLHCLWYFFCNVLNLLLALYLKVHPLYKRITIDTLSEGLNKAVAVMGKVLLFVKHESVAPL